MALAITCGLFTAGCHTLVYKAYEKVGIEKRHLLRKNIEKTRDEQTEAADQFRDALTQLKELYGFDGGDLEAEYRKLNKEYERCKARADDVHKRIGTVRRIAKDMFREWEGEIKEIQTPSLRTRSETALRKTRARYERLEQALEQSEDRMDPVLHLLREYVLTLKHELNAKAIGALEQEADDIEGEVFHLLKDMNHAIRETETFLADFE